MNSKIHKLNNLTRKPQRYSTKTEVEDPEPGKTPVAVGGAKVVRISIVPRAATQHAPMLTSPQTLRSLAQTLSFAEQLLFI